MKDQYDNLSKDPIIDGVISHEIRSGYCIYCGKTKDEIKMKYGVIDP